MNDDHTFAPEMTAEEAIQMVLKRPEMYGLQRVTAVPDVATELRAERDAALEAIERIRQAVSGHPECDRYEEGDVISCGWKSAYASVVAALAGAPEPEWEYGMQDDYGLSFMRNIAEAYDHANRQDPELNPRPVRRRKAGPWLPVGGESNGA